MRPKGWNERKRHLLQVPARPLKLRIGSTYLPEAGTACPAVSLVASLTHKGLLTKSERYNIAKRLTIARLLEDSH